MSKLKMIRLFLLNLVLVGIVIPGYSQDPTTLGKINIASPNAASLGKYGDIPVSYHTGVPNISIPLYTVSSGSLKLPISLSYHTSGLKVEENGSWVGAGWTLNAGGAIIRTVKDKPDEKQTSSLSQTYGHYSDYGMASYWQNSNSDQSNIDVEPDLFFFNFNGYSGKFWFNDDRTPMILPEQDFKIECSYTPGIWNNSPGASSGLGRCIESFTITTPDGTKYYFGIPQTPVQSPYCDPIEVTSTMTAQSGTSYSQVISSWFLNKIVSPNGNSSINLNYTRDKYAFYTFINPPVGNFGSSGTNYKYSLVKNLMAGVLLSQITGANEKVDFVPGAARLDLSRWASGIDESLTDNINQSSPVLGSINFSDILGNCYKKFNFSYDYFTDNATPAVSYFSEIISDQKRLKLNSLQEVSCDGTISIPPYRFDYFTEQVPRKLSFSRDHWGYNNGVTTNTQLYPALSDNNGVLNLSANLGIADRESSWPAMRAGTLNKIIYPTGGTTSFDFEANTFTVNKVVNGQIVPTDMIVGGLRIKTITNFEPVANKTSVTPYSYLTQGTNLSSGILYSKPTYIQVFRNDWFKMTNFLGNINGNGCWDTYDANVVTSWPYIFSDNPLRPMETTQGYHIGYGEVKVTQTNNGYSIYRFSVTPPWQVNRDNITITQISNPSTCDITISNYPPAPLPDDYYRGEPTYEGHFNQDGTVIAEKIFQTTYQENPVTTPGRCTYSFSTSTTPFTAVTYYELKTAHKTQSTVTERTYQTGGSVIEKQTQTLYENIYHHEPSKIISTDSKGLSIEKRIKYAFDYRVPVFENTTNCYTGAASFLSYFNSLYYSGEYNTQFASCPGYTSSCYGTTLQNYYTALFNARKSYIDCRKTNYTNTNPLNTYQTNHNTAKLNANTELKPLLWMQDIFMNSPVETSEWKNNQLANATYNKYSNYRDDAYGAYPDKTLKIDLAAPSATFTASAVGADNISISKDSRYADLSAYDFNKGNVISVVSRDGVPASYDWGYNQNFPVVKIGNAANKYKENVQPGTVTNSFNFPLGPSNPTSGSLQGTFTQIQSGTITISLPALPSGAQATSNFTLTGPVSQSGYLCASGSGGASCSTTPSSINYSNMPAGQYTLSATVNTSFQSYTFNYSLSYSYQGMFIISTGLKEFFYEGFEENTGGSVVTGTAHTGTKYWNANYTTSFTPPNGRSYVIQWWNLSGGTWNFNQQVYTGNVTLTGPVDDIRIFPADAQISTYTYKPLAGMSSETNTNGRTTYYEYDILNRLNIVKDNEKNVVKKLCYTYSGQTENCVVQTFYNVAKSGTFTRNNCSAGYIGSTVTYTVPAGTYTSLISQADADAKAQADVNANGQNYANSTGTCSQMIDVVGSNSKSLIYSVGFSNTLTGASYSFTLNAYSSNITLGQVAAGTYNVTFSPIGSPTSATYNVNGYSQSSSYGVTFYNISVTGTTTVSVN